MGEMATGSGQLRLVSITGDETYPVARYQGILTLKNLHGPFTAPIFTKSGTGAVELRGEIPATHNGTSKMTVSKHFTFEGAGPGPGAETLTNKVEIEDALETAITYH
jgi:hypothetical protein